MKPRVFLVLFFGLMLLAAARAAVAQTPGPQSPDAGQAALGTAFTYQGLLRQGGNPVNTTCDFQFSLYNAFAVGTRVGSTQTRSAIGVTDGRFVVQLSFGEGAFNGEARWLQIAVRCPAGSGTYTTLSPRQELTPAPHALALPGLWTRQNIISTNIIGGYHGNGVTAGVAGATIAGGGRLGATNRVTDDFGTVGGGSNNQAGDGVGTTAAKGHATVSGGENNVASGWVAAVTGGQLNTASGDYATVDGGWGNTALGNYSFAAGLRAKANHNGAFVWGDATSGDISSPAPNTFIVRANGGFWFGRAATSLTPVIGPGIFISTSTGAHLTVGGAWSNASDRNAKENFVPVNGEEILARLAEIPIQTWNYQAEDAAVRHVGPTAQDFYAAFGVGNSDTSISTVDAEGVALAAIQGLYQMVQEKDVQIAAQQEEIDKLAARLAAVEEAMGKGGAPSRHGEPGLPGGWPLLGGLLVVGLVLWPRARAGGR